MLPFLVVKEKRDEKKKTIKNEAALDVQNLNHYCQALYYSLFLIASSIKGISINKERINDGCLWC